MKGATNVQIKGLDDKRQINATFVVFAFSMFSPMQLIYNDKTELLFSKFHSHLAPMKDTNQITGQIKKKE